MTDSTYAPYTPIMNIGILIAVAGIVAAVLYLAVFSPAAQAGARLRSRASLDFSNARGTLHLKMMRDAQAKHQRTIDSCEAALAAAQKQVSNIKAQRDEDLRKTLESHMLRTRLREIPGVGPTLSEQLREYAEAHGSARSLRSASQHLVGVGPARQAAIDAWLSNYEATESALLASEFPGKDEVQTQAKARLAEVGKEIKKLVAQKSAVSVKLDRLNAEIKPLASVSYSDFMRALQNEAAPPPELDHYLRGAFAEWEPVPDWFKECVGEVAP